MALRPFFLTGAQTRTEMISRRRRAAICAVVLSASVASAMAADASLPLVPMPAKIEMAAGQFAVTGAPPVICNRADKDTAFACDFIRGVLSRPFLEVQPPSETQHPIVFEHLSDPDATGKEGYRVVVAPDRVTVSASTSAGLYYGAVTLWQLLSASDCRTSNTVGCSTAIPAMSIEDRPRFAWRGLLLDSVRHFQSVAAVEQLIDTMSREKLNVLQWHLTDDQGWRIQIKAYPRLTSVGAWRVPAGYAPAQEIDHLTGKPRLYGGFYTQAEIRAVVAYASQRNVAIVPEIEMPGHAMAAIVAYPWLGSVQHPPRAVSSDWGVFPYLYNPSDRTFRFLETVLKETMALFPSRYIHVGGDEAVKDQWKASPQVQALMRKLKIKDEDALQSWLIRRIEKYLNAHGRRLIGWDEILQGGIAPNATITSWRGINGAVTAAKSGHDAVLSPAPILYFDNRQAEGANEPSGRGPIIPLDQVYGFDPVPAALSPDEARYIIGVQANIWTEHIRLEENVFYAAFPRAAALAEIAWSPPAAHDWTNFRQRMRAELDRYKLQGIRYSTAGVIDPPLQPPSATHRDSHELKLCSEAVSLSVEGPAPLYDRRPVFLHDVLNPCWIWQKADLTGRSAIAIRAGLLPFNYQVGTDARHVPLRPPKTPDGEAQIHLDACEGPVIATLPMRQPKAYEGLVAAAGPIAPRTGVHDLCILFTRDKLDSYWALHDIDLAPDAMEP